MLYVALAITGVNKHVRIDKLKNTHKMQFGKAAVAAVDVTFLKEMPAGTKLSITVSFLLMH